VPGPGPGLDRAVFHDKRCSNHLSKVHQICVSTCDGVSHGIHRDNENYGAASLIRFSTEPKFFKRGG
jgi:hypothetical protein